MNFAHWVYTITAIIMLFLIIQPKIFHSIAAPRRHQREVSTLLARIDQYYNQIDEYNLYQNLTKIEIRKIMMTLQDAKTKLCEERKTRGFASNYEESLDNINGIKLEIDEALTKFDDFLSKEKAVYLFLNNLELLILQHSDQEKENQYKMIKDISTLDIIKAYNLMKVVA
jgi:hypothetical protein